MSSWVKLAQIPINRPWCHTLLHHSTWWIWVACASVHANCLTWSPICCISVSGLSGTKEVAQSQVLIGMGLLAGSTVMLLTLLWGSCVVVGKCDLSENSTAIDSRDTKGFSLLGMPHTHFVFHSLLLILFHYGSRFAEHPFTWTRNLFLICNKAMLGSWQVVVTFKFSWKFGVRACLLTYWYGY